jgi:hypothetical protein
MSCVYRRGKSLWVAFKDERGMRVCRPSGYKVGQEDAARALLAELDRKATDARGAVVLPRSGGQPAGTSAKPWRIALPRVNPCRIMRQPVIGPE